MLRARSIPVEVTSVAPAIPAALPLPEQTEPLAEGRRLSPHDPLLPLLLAGPVAVGGWVGAKLAMAAMAGLLAALALWTAGCRLGVPIGTTALAVLAAVAALLSQGAGRPWSWAGRWWPCPGWG
jgi:hypothetical protein